MAKRAKRPKKRPTDLRPRDASQAQLFLNRELSWLAFNNRVLDEACNPQTPLAERLKFQAIVNSNLDEFFMVRVAGLKQQLTGGIEDTAADGMSPREQLSAISRLVHDMVTRQYDNWRNEVAPALAEKAGVCLLLPNDLTPEQKAAVQAYFKSDVWPVLTPLAVDQGHPFPVLRNRSLNLVILLRKENEPMLRRETIIAVVQVPAILPRLVDISPDKPHVVLLEDVIAMHAGDLFPGFKVLSCSPFRITRNFDLDIDEDEADDLLKTIQKELRRRERGQAVRMTIAMGAPPEVVTFLQKALRLEAEDTYLINGPLNLGDLLPLYSREQLKPFREEPFSSQPVPPLQEYDDFFKVLRQRDILLHHPYETFDHVIEFISEAADDPNVLAIKQTLYRTSADSPIVRSLMRAAENGKQVTAVVELKARFDEGSNIEWARMLEESGVHVVYGLVGLKTHCKMSLVVRREGTKIKRYVHLSTGNYNPATARLYSDLSLLTAREEFADDAGALFNLITGYSSPPSWKRFAVAPVGLSERIIELIERETTLKDKGRIVAKMNSLVDPDVIRALYRASAAGVRIDLLIRGICCLRPGVPGTSENIRVTSIVDRFLEHARIFHFGNGGSDEVYLSSADWMPRNFVRRVEVLFPIEEPELRRRIIDEILANQLADNVKACRLNADGAYERRKPGEAEPVVRSQVRFMELARRKSAGTDEPRSSATTLTVRTPPQEARPALTHPVVALPQDELAKTLVS
ncbi:MAG: polyphosphate kinase 1 [Deltaproteobacteria bacterium]|nr:polyphosphate kinase 1 [Deltaproteobacteria bacterium]